MPQIPQPGRPYPGPEVGDIEVAFDTTVGLCGTIYAKELTFELKPIAETETDWHSELLIMPRRSADLVAYATLQHAFE